ncbi:MAG: helix-turn-helix transcriptional regulator, partial [Frankia sp.]|nr:helix-turn-helix transcriptional regulator [Frankia sp.]
AQLAGDDPPPTLPPGLTPPGWDIDDDDAGDGAELADRVPPAIAAAVGAEIAALPAAARTLAQGAAVAGEVFDPDLAAAAAGFGETEDGTTVLDAIDALVRADVIRTTEMPRRFAFRHPIVRHAVYVSAGPGWRLAAHARAAEALAAHGASATARAHHVERAARPGDEAAISLLTEAAEANRLRAPAAAARWYAAALRLLPSPAAPTAATATTEGGLDLRRLSLLSRLAGALDASYQPERARGVLDEILARLPRSLAEQRAQVIALRSAVDHMLGRHGEARALVLDAMAAADPSSREGCLLRIQLAIDHFYTAEYEGMRRWQQEAHRLVGRLGDPALFAVSAGLLAGAEYMTSGMAAAASPLTVAGHQYDLLTDDQVLPHVLMLGWLGWTEIYMERFTDAARHLERADAIARRTGRGAASVMMSVGRATLAGWRGRVGEAARLAEDAVESCLLAPHLPFLSWALAIRCSTSTLSGELADALRFGAQAVRAARPETDTISVLAGSHYAEALVEAGEPVRAIEELLSAAGGPSLRRIETAYHPYWCELLTRAELARVGETAGAGAGADGADASLTEVVAAADRWACRAEETAAGAGGSLPGRLASALRARAAVDLARGDAKAAAERALESAAAADQAELVIESGRSRTLAGRALATLGDTAAAVAELRRAEARLRAAGANRPGDEAARLLRQLGQRVARGGRPAGRASEPGQDGAAARLSARERQIAQLVAAGQTNKQIAAQLFVSEKTVESHLTKVLAKLGVPSRAAVGAALRD